MIASAYTYEGAGFRVVGMAWTNNVVQDLKADGFKDASTIASALGRLDRGREKWDAKTVLVVDEAAMLSSRQLGRIMGMAKDAGARVILAGDDKQLASIERGGIFSALQAEHGAAELHTVRRVTDAAQKAAFNHMHAGRFGEALGIFDQAGAIRWTDTQAEARAALVGQWAADTKAAPGKSRFVFAYSNADVDALNADLRAVMRERGVLGDDQRLRTKDGPAEFAKGDRMQFTGSAYYQADRAAGLVNGGVGTVREIEGASVTVELDGKGGKPGRTVRFTVGDNAEAGQFNAIRHGYAGTIYKGQGRTLDQSYLYHSQHWRAASAYVGLSRHRDSTALFVAREVTRGAEPWMMGQGGLDMLDEKQRLSADKSYQAWAEASPGPAAKYGLAEYVAYVQDKQGERGRSAFDMDQLGRQIGRADETRAASQFVADAGTPKAPPSDMPSLSGVLRYAAMVAKAAEMAARRAADPMADLMGRRSRFGRYDELKRAAAQAAATPKAPPPSPPAARGAYADLMAPDLAAKAEAERLAAERLKQSQSKGKGKSGRYDGPGF